jgi:hypothetical protein
VKTSTGIRPHLNLPFKIKKTECIKEKVVNIRDNYFWNISTSKIKVAISIETIDTVLYRSHINHLLKYLLSISQAALG